MGEHPKPPYGRPLAGVGMLEAVSCFAQLTF
jgi:hypothetical protein